MGVLKKQQVVVVGGGETFDTYEDYLRFLKYDLSYDPSPRTKNWKESLQEDLGPKYQVLYPKMPNPLNAKYEEWFIYFNKVLAHIDAGAIFIGHSLGGLFLFNALDSWDAQPRATIFVSTPLSREKGFADFAMKNRITAGNFGEVHIFHSKDDPIVNVSEAFIYNSHFIDAKMHLLSDHGHFINNEHFPELVKVIKSMNRR